MPAHQSAADFWRRRIFAIARDRIIHVTRPLAATLAPALLLAVLLLALPSPYVPLQLPLFALALARAVAMVQLVKVRRHSHE